MRAIIMAGGDGTRWNNYLGTPKHLLTLEGERLIDRTIRLLDERGVEEIIPLCPYPDVPNSQLPAYTQCDTDKFRSTIPLWAPDALSLVLYGDVWFSEEAMDAIISPLQDPFRWFGREHASKITGTPYGELFGLTIAPEGQARISHSIETVRGLLMNNRIGRGGGWEVYRHSVGVPLSKHVLNGYFHDINDWTDDFDFPADYDRWVASRPL